MLQVWICHDVQGTAMQGVSSQSVVYHRANMSAIKLTRLDEPLTFTCSFGVLYSKPKETQSTWSNVNRPGETARKAVAAHGNVHILRVAVACIHLLCVSIQDRDPSQIQQEPLTDCGSTASRFMCLAVEERFTASDGFGGGLRESLVPACQSIHLRELRLRKCL